MTKRKTPLRVGINGFGRIGRAVCRIGRATKAFTVVAVNDLDPDVANLGYLLKYDSIYGRFDGSVEVQNDGLLIDGDKAAFFSQRESEKVPWGSVGVDVLIDATGARDNVTAAGRLVAAGRVKKAVVTWSPLSGVDLTVIFGVNEKAYDARKHGVVSSSICDAIASAPVLKIVDEAFGIENAWITTLHPWLQYQNLLDGPVSSVASPGHFWKDYSLGRASLYSLIPKETTLCGALAKVLPDLTPRLQAMSFRIPTGIVAASDMTLVLKRAATADQLNDVLRAAADRNHALGFQTDHLVSIDFARISESAIIDGRWTKVADGTHAKLVLWYDNEWGYSSRVVDCVSLVGGTLQT